ncbi:MAG: hypothetical protein AB7G17_02675 [Phycisphaerales bacterium]
MTKRSASIVTVAALSCIAFGARAETVTYSVDTSRSALTLSGAVRYYFNGSVFGYAEQGAGSLMASYGGTITGELVGSSLSFAGGSNIVGLANAAGPFLPAGPGTTDVYGMQTFASGGGHAFNRIYDVALDLTGGAASHGAAFSGSVAYIGESGGIFPFFDPTPRSLAGVSATNTAGVAVSIMTAGFVETITIPFDVNLILFGNGTGAEMRLTGEIVATREIPAPGAGALMMVGAGWAARRRR